MFVIKLTAVYLLLTVLQLAYTSGIQLNSSTQVNDEQCPLWQQKTTTVICSRYKRQGQMCGSCMEGYSPPVYSYSPSCVNCTTSNWAKYTAVPVTAFSIFVITFRLSAASPKLHGLILSSQIISCPSNMRILYNGEGFSPLGETGPLKGEEVALPTTLSGLGSCPRSLLDLRGWGVLWGRGFEEAILVQTTVVECKNKNNKR